MEPSTHPLSEDADTDGMLPDYVPMKWTLKEIHDAIPKRLMIRNTKLGLLYFARDLVMAAILCYCAAYIDSAFMHARVQSAITPTGAQIARWVAWGAYWWFQGLTFTGLWVIGHECGHGGFSESRILCDTLGWVLHTALLTPYFSWKISHHSHHSHHASMEKDIVYVPKTRSDLGIPAEKKGHHIDYEEYFGDTPIYTMFLLIRQQLLAFPVYLLTNVSGQKSDKWINHFDPNSPLFNASHRNAVLFSDASLFMMSWLLVYISTVFGSWSVIKYYGIPWLSVTHWFVMITYLQHTDPRLPHYRKTEWSFQRGAVSTVDRDFLGWQGRFFLHDVAHYHVIHHFFPKMPFYNGKEATKYLREMIGEHYAYSDEPVFKALWRSYNDCQFVEDEGDVIFYKNRKGRALRRAAPRSNAM